MNSQRLAWQGRVALQVNVDHVATLRQARGGTHPDPVAAALLCEQAGADGITVHLREDRRHIQDRDVELLRPLLATRLNLEMAAVPEMIAVALRIKPACVTLVPERRMERTTEGGLQLRGREAFFASVCRQLRAAGSEVSLFLSVDAEELACAAALPIDRIELHTGEYAHAVGAAQQHELSRLRQAAAHIAAWPTPCEVAAGHGLTQRNVEALVAEVPEIRELNIGHALVSDAVFCGLTQSIAAFRAAIDRGAARR